MKPENKQKIEFSRRFANLITVADALGVGVIINIDSGKIEIGLDESVGMADGAFESVLSAWERFGGKLKKIEKNGMVTGAGLIE